MINTVDYDTFRYKYKIQLVFQVQINILVRWKVNILPKYLNIYLLLKWNVIRVPNTFYQRDKWNDTLLTVYTFSNFQTNNNRLKLKLKLKY